MALASLFCLLLAAAAGGCRRSDGNADERHVEGNGGAPDDGGNGDKGAVAVILYFRYDTPEKPWLAPEKRIVDAAEPCLAAMEALIAGPGQGSSLKPVLPETVRVLEVALENGVCTLDVSKEILTDSSKVGAGASSEMLALAAIADTLTGLEGVERVKLLVEGTQSGMVEGRLVEDFWGHVGLPEYLERNEAVIYNEP